MRFDMLKDSGLLAKFDDSGLQDHYVARPQLAAKVGLRAHNGKRHLPPPDFLWSSSKSVR